MTLKTSHRTRDISLARRDKHSLQLWIPWCFSYPSFTQNDFACMEWCEFIQTGFAGRQTDHIISEGQDTFIWPCSGRSRGQNKTQFDSYYGRLAAVHFKTKIIWSGWDVQVWNFMKCQRALQMQRPPLHCSNLHHVAARILQSSLKQCTMQCFLAHFIKGLHFSQLLFSPQSSRRDIQ